MDTYFPPSKSFLGLALITTKANASAFSLALLDLSFSSVERISFRSIFGAWTWNATSCVSMWILCTRFGGCDQMMICSISDLQNPARLFMEYFRFVLLLIFSGIITDLVFPPMHRLTHSSRWLYTRHHARHHEYRSRLTSLVLFHGEELDNLLMAACPIVGFSGTMAAWGAASALLPPLWRSSGPYMSTLTWCDTLPPLPAPRLRAKLPLLRGRNACQRSGRIRTVPRLGGSRGVRGLPCNASGG